jgi:hypothetical protein
MPIRRKLKDLVLHPIEPASNMAKIAERRAA